MQGGMEDGRWSGIGFSRKERIKEGKEVEKCGGVKGSWNKGFLKKVITDEV
jgi:hypothetical protein